MPIYMDRHDVSETVTAAHVAQLHQEDLKVQDQFGCKGLTYWFDEKRKMAFCLIEAPDMQCLEDMHNKAHGEIPHSIIEVDASIVESFLGRIKDPEKAKDSTLNIINDPAFRTIMLVEINELPHNRLDTVQYKKSLNNFYKALPGIINSYEGTVVKQRENHLLVSFKVVSNAVHATVDIHALFKHFIKDFGQTANIFKSGLSAGVPVTQKKFIFEDCINLAQRMCDFMNTEITVSSDVKNLYDSENLKPIAEIKNITTLSPTDELFLTHFMDYTEKTWTDVNLKAIDFCKPVGCSKSQLYRKMISLTGKSPNVFIKDYRLKKALHSLNKKTGNISEIAFETGFSSPSYFSKCFLKRFGHIPSEYLPVKVG